MGENPCIHRADGSQACDGTQMLDGCLWKVMTQAQAPEGFEKINQTIDLQGFFVFSF